ncbi:MAG TPA: LamG-like jellyroll fold domain-containing protein [Flavobacteriales bacterium]|nr:LamG-like jellyroll fold domain-containing protein [Flavobacteriales bacterium]
MKKIILITITIFLANFSYTQVTSGLVAKYSFNGGNANDEVGSNNGTVNGATLTTDRFGNINHAYYLDGISNNIDLGSSTTLKQSVASVSLWANVSGISTSGAGYNYNPIFLIKNTATGSSFFEGAAIYLSASDSKVAVVTTDFSTLTEKYFFTTTALTNSLWYHFVLVYTDDSLKLYVNGILENKIAKGFASTFSATEPVLLGASGDPSNDRYFNGTLDDIRIYNRAITLEEVDSLFNEADPATVGLAEFSAVNSITVFPNPATNMVYINGTYTVNLTDVSGKIVMKKENAQNIDITNQPAGVYVLELVKETGEIIQKSKLIKY